MPAWGPLTVLVMPTFGFSVILVLSRDFLKRNLESLLFKIYSQAVLCLLRNILEIFSFDFLNIPIKYLVEYSTYDKIQFFVC